MTLPPQNNQRTKAVSLDVRADGPRQILRITNYDPERSLYKPRQRSNSIGITRQDTISSSAEAFEAIAEEVISTFSFTLDVAGIGVSLINRRLVEVIYVTMDALRFEYANTTVAQSINLSCGSVQIDNQLHDALFPVILQPTPINKESMDVGALPTIQASLIWLKDTGRYSSCSLRCYLTVYHSEHGVLFVKYFSVLLQALTIEADEDLLFAIYDLTQIKGASWEDGVDE